MISGFFKMILSKNAGDVTPSFIQYNFYKLIFHCNQFSAPFRVFFISNKFYLMANKFDTKFISTRTDNR